MNLRNKSHMCNAWCGWLLFRSFLPCCLGFGFHEGFGSHRWFGVLLWTACLAVVPWLGASLPRGGGLAATYGYPSRVLGMAAGPPWRTR